MSFTGLMNKLKKILLWVFWNIFQKFLSLQKCCISKSSNFKIWTPSLYQNWTPGIVSKLTKIFNYKI